MPMLVAVIYWFVNRHFDAPAYQQDEIGYLINGAFLAGFVVDGYSSYHAGYSLFLAPLFLIANDPEAIWYGLQVINSLFWGGSFYLLDVFIQKTFPFTNLRRRIVVILICAIYPSWIVIAGYGFSQSVFIFFYITSALALMKWKPEEPSSVLPHTLLIGFLFWIHPTAAGVIVASIAAIFYGCWKKYSYQSLLLHFILILVMAAVYKLGIQVWMMREMTPDGYEVRSHYPSTASLLASLTKVKFWGDFFVLILGQLSYLLIATFGAIFIGISFLIKSIYQNWLACFNKLKLEDQIDPIVSIYLLISLLGLLVITALSFSSQAHGPGSLDEWFYGRYVEGVMLPILAISIAGWKAQGLKQVLFVATGIVLVGALIQALFSDNYLNLVNILSFWPQVLAPKESVMYWFLLGAIGVTGCLTFYKPVSFLMIVISAIFTIQAHQQWHENILKDYSKPTQLIDFVRLNFSKGECVGFDPYLPPGSTLQEAERVRLYSYYLYDYKYQRMSFSQWEEQCNGPFFTYDTSILSNSHNVRLAGIEPRTGLRLFVKNRNTKFEEVINKQKYSGVAWSAQLSSECLSATKCSVRTSSDLSLTSQVGLLGNKYFFTDSNAGFLFYGPYLKLKKGQYLVRLHGNYQNVNGAIIDVVSKKATVSHFHMPLNVSEQKMINLIEIKFMLDEDVDDLEVRLFVEQNTNLNISLLELIAIKD